jgi:hypothetical protein
MAILGNQSFTKIHSAGNFGVIASPLDAFTIRDQG